MRTGTLWYRLKHDRIGIVFVAGAFLVAGAPQTVLGQSRNADVDRLFDAFVQPGEPGCSVAVMREGEVVHASAYGLADVAKQKRLSPGSVFNIASVSKQFTAFSILLLEAQGELSIDDRLVKYVPELSASAGDVTLRHLIHHTGGLRDYMDLLLLGGRTTEEGATQHETVQLLARQKAANTAPGTEYAYSNSGYVLLATVVERVSGVSMKQFAQENIFGPLGMSGTTIIDRYPAGLPGLARGYTKEGEGFRIDESAWEQVGDGQVHTTATDMFRWAENFHSGKVGGHGVMARMQETGVLASGERLGYAAGLGIAEHDGRPTISHSGGWAGYGAFFLYFPEQRFTANVFCNRNDVDARHIATALADLFLDGESPSRQGSTDDELPGDEDHVPAAEWQPANLSHFEGAYWSEEAQARCVLVQRDSQLVLEGCADGLPMQPAKPAEFYIPAIDVRIRFRQQSGRATGFSLRSSGLYDLAFVRR
jgi:CubicO group peptidase (beta-lactamase class C family)